jgi:hypothetical protein
MNLQFIICGNTRKLEDFGNTRFRLVAQFIICYNCGNTRKLESTSEIPDSAKLRH